MADQKISQLSSGAPAQAGDEYVVARSGANYKLTLTNIAANMPATTVASGDLIVSSGNVQVGTTTAAAGGLLTLNRAPAAAFGTPMLQVGGASFTSGGYYSIGLGFTDATYTEPPGEIAFATTSDSGGTSGSIVFGTRSVTTNTAVTERMRIDSSGNVGIGGTASAFDKVTVTGTLPTSSNISVGYAQRGTIPSGTTSQAASFSSYPSTQAASFTLNQLVHYWALQNTLGAGSAVTNQYGFFVDPSLTGATNNYGFYSNIASGSNRWNFYAAGTAQNYMAGRLGINNTTFADSEMLRVTQANANTGAIIDVTASSSTGSAGLRIRKFDNDNTTAQTYIAFDYNNGASGAGGIQGNGGSGPQFYNSSDARLKENVVDLDGQLAKILALKPRKFDFINGPKDCTGFIAQEMETVYPDSVGEDVDGFKTIGGISVMEARLIKAIQELTARVAELEAK